MARIPRTHAAVASLLLLLAACGDDSEPAGPVPVAGVSVTPGTFEIDVGETKQLQAVVTDAHGNVLEDRAVSFVSDDASVATVDAGGLVTGEGEGEATITATSGGVSDEASATVLLPDFEPDADTELSGDRRYGTLSIPDGVTVTATADLTLSVAGVVTIGGVLAGRCVAVNVEGAGAVEVTGTVDNACDAASDGAPGVTLASDGPMTLDGATVRSSGDVVIRTAPGLVPGDFPGADPDPEAGLVMDDTDIVHSPEHAASGGPGERGADGRAITVLVAGDLDARASTLAAQSGGDAGATEASGPGASATGADGGDGGAVEIFVAGTAALGASDGGGTAGPSAALGLQDTPPDYVVVRGGNGGDGGDAKATNDGSDPADLDATARSGSGGAGHFGRLVAGDVSRDRLVFRLPRAGKDGDVEVRAADGPASTEDGDPPGDGGSARATVGGEEPREFIIVPEGGCVAGPGVEPSGSCYLFIPRHAAANVSGNLRVEPPSPSGPMADPPRITIRSGNGGDLLHDGPERAGDGGPADVITPPPVPPFILERDGSTNELTPPGRFPDVLLGGGEGGDARLGGVCDLDPIPTGHPGGNGALVNLRIDMDDGPPTVPVEIVELDLRGVQPIDPGAVPLNGGDGSDGSPPGGGGEPGTVRAGAEGGNVDSSFDVFVELDAGPDWGPPEPGLPGGGCVQPPPPGPFDIFFDDLPNTNGNVPDGTVERRLFGPDGNAVGVFPLIVESRAGGVRTSAQDDIGLTDGGRIILDFGNGGFDNGAPLPANVPGVTICPLFGEGVGPSNPFTVTVEPPGGPREVFEFPSVPINQGQPRSQWTCLEVTPDGPGVDRLIVESGTNHFIAIQDMRIPER